MILEIIIKLKEQILEDASAKRLFEQYNEKQDTIGEIRLLQREVERISLDKSELDNEVEAYSFLKKIFDRKNYKEISTKLDKAKKKLAKTKTKILQLQAQVDSVEFVDDHLKKIKLYELVKKMDKAYDQNNIEEAIKSLIEYFETDFNKLISFCNSNGIMLDFSNKVEFDFMERFMAERVRYVSAKGLNIKKYSKLEDLILVRKVKDTIPVNDRLIPAYKEYFKQKEVEISYDKKKYLINVTVPSGWTTLHFMLNKEVPIENWKDCNVIIMQPLTEKLYNQAAGLNPTDIVFENTVDLENYLMICDSKEKAQEIMKINKNATVFVFSKEMVNHSGNRILRCLDYCVLYKDYNGVRIESEYLYRDCFDEEFISKYPRLVTDLTRGPENKIHNFLGTLIDIYIKSQAIDYVLELALKEENFDEALEKICESSLGVTSFISFSSCKYENIKLSSLLDSQYKGFSLFLDEIMSLDEYQFDPQVIFEKLIEDISVTEENRNALLKIKEVIIEEVSIFVPDPYHPEGYNKLIYKLFVLRKIATSKVVNKQIVKEPKLDEMLEYCDFSNLEVFINDIVKRNLSEGKSLKDCKSELVNVPRQSFLDFFELKLTRPEDNCTNNFIQQLESIRKIKDLKQRIEKEESLINNFLFPNEELKFLFEGYLDNYLSSKDSINQKIVYFSSVMLMLKYYNPQLINEEIFDKGNSHHK